MLVFKKTERLTRCAVLAVLTMLLFTACAVNKETPPASVAPPGQNEAAPDSDQAAPGTVTISFDFTRQKGVASNQFAVWIEDAAGDYVKTLYVTRFTAQKGWRTRPDSIPEWVQKAKVSEMSEGQVAAVTAATPAAGTLTYTWDCTDQDGRPVPDGTYSFIVEGSLRWQMRVFYSGTVSIGGGTQYAEAAAEYFGDEGTERGMIGPVTAVYNN